MKGVIPGGGWYVRLEDNEGAREEWAAQIICWELDDDSERDHVDFYIAADDADIWDKVDIDLNGWVIAKFVAPGEYHFDGLVKQMRTEGSK